MDHNIHQSSMGCVLKKLSRIAMKKLCFIALYSNSSPNVNLISRKNTFVKTNFSVKSISRNFLKVPLPKEKNHAMENHVRRGIAEPRYHTTT